jgi:hypothetical protein
VSLRGVMCKYKHIETNAAIRPSETGNNKYRAEPSFDKSCPLSTDVDPDNL